MISWLWIIVVAPLWWLTRLGFLKAAKHLTNGQGMSWLVIAVAVPFWWLTRVGFLQME